MFTVTDGLSSWAVICRHLRLKSTLSFGPGAFDKGKHGGNVSIAQFALERGHVALIAGDDRPDAELGDREQTLIGMVPGVSGFIMRRCGHSAGIQPALPVGLSLEVRTVAGGAVRAIKLPAEIDLLRRDRFPQKGKPVRNFRCLRQHQPPGRGKCRAQTAAQKNDPRLISAPADI